MRRIWAGALGLLVAGAVDAHAVRQDAAALRTRIDALLQQAVDLGPRLTAGSDDRGARSEARGALDAAERLAKAELKRDPACEPCVEGQASVHFYRALFGIAREYDDCVEVVDRGLARFPQNARLTFIKGYAHYNRNEFREASAAFKRFLAANPDSPQAEAVRQVVADSEQKFLGSWYNQANFYQSNESRIVQMNPQTLRNDIVFQFTPDYELQLGQQGFTALATAAPVASDPETAAFLQQLVGRLTEKTPGPGFRYQVTILDSPEVNAVTPPGHILVYTGLLRFVETEAQLAGVLAHEIAHNYGHHSARRLIKAYHAQNVANLIARAVNPQGAVPQLVTQLSASIGLDLFLKAYSRFEEREADLYGAHLMFNAAYHPTAMSSFFLKLYEANPRQPAKFLSTHPPHPDRVDYLSDYLEGFPLGGDLVVDSSEAFKRIKLRYPSGGPSMTEGARPPALPPGGSRPPGPSAPLPTSTSSAPISTPPAVPPPPAPAPAPPPAPPPTTSSPGTGATPQVPPTTLPMPGAPLVAPGLTGSAPRATTSRPAAPTPAAHPPPKTSAPPPASATGARPVTAARPTAGRSPGAPAPPQGPARTPDEEPVVFDLTGSSDVIDIELVEDDPPASLAPPAIPRGLPPVDCAASRRSLTELEFEQQQIAQRYDEVAARLDRDIEAEGKAPASRRAQARRKREFTERELEKWQQEADRVMPEIARLRMVLSVASCQ